MPGEITASIAAPFRRSLHAPPDEITLRLWPTRTDPRTAPRRPPRQRTVPLDLTRPLSDNSMLRARLGVGRRRSAAIGVVIGAVAVLGIALSLASYTRDDWAPTSEVAPAGPNPIDSPRTGALPVDATLPRTFNLVTNVEIKTSYPAPPEEPAVEPVKNKSKRPAPPVEDNPYSSSRSTTPAPTLTAQPAVDDNPY